MSCQTLMMTPDYLREWAKFRLISCLSKVRSPRPLRIQTCSKNNCNLMVL
uniref:Uncharacterized protein n=1 Tax=Arundo donax TaxID=35708 RepID=A0A0A9AZ11_ARUDO